MTAREALTLIKTSLENTAIAAVKSLKAHIFRVDIGEKTFAVSNFPKTQQVAGKVEVTNNSPLESQLKAVVEWLRKVENRLQTLKPYEQVKVANFPQYPKFPDFPKEIAVSKPIEVSEKSLSAVVEAVKRLTDMVSKFPTKYPEVKIPPFPKVEIPPFPEIPKPLKTVSVDNLEKIVSTDPKKYVPVRLSDGEEFYKALEELSVAAGRSYAYSDSQGAKQQGLVDSDRHVQVDIISQPETNYASLIDKVSDSLTYICTACPGTQEDEELWRIQRITKAGTVTRTEFPDGDNTFAFRADRRETYDYK